MTFKIHTIIGTRPQFIKAAVFSRAVQKCPHIEENIIHTGQHFDSNMSDVFFDELNIPKPKHSLNIAGGSHGQSSGRMLEQIEKVLMEDRPDAVLVYGDTNTTLAGALAAAKLHIPIIHIEAGLRSFNKKMPEEINRVLTDHISSYLFCSTEASIENLKNEGITEGVYQVGDIMYDATLYAIEQIKKHENFYEKFKDLPNRYALMTVHRAESTADKIMLEKIIAYAINFSNEHHLKIIFPVHPRTKNLLNFKSLKDNFILLDPLAYYEMQFYLSKASYVLTDSGGLQKEAYFHRVPCVTLRSETEWVETVAHGWNRLWSEAHYQPKKDIGEYGLGNSAEKIVETLIQEVL